MPSTRNTYSELAVAKAKSNRSSPGIRFQSTISLKNQTTTPKNFRRKSTLVVPPSQNQQHSGSSPVSLTQLLEQILTKPRTIPIPRWITPRHYTVTYSECFGHSSFILVAMSYATDDFLMLRILAVVGSTSMLFFTYFHPHGKVLWLPFKWNLLFIAINSYRISKVFVDKYKAEQLPAEIMHLRNNYFYVMDHVDFSKLVRAGTIKEHKKGDLILTQGEMNPFVRLVLNGEVCALFDGKITYCMEEGNFIAESGLHVGLLLPGSVESCCTVVVRSEKARVLVWERDDLVDLMRRDSGLRRSLKAVLSWDLIRKLKSQRLQLTEGIIGDNPEAWTERRKQQTWYRYEAILRNLLSHPEYLKKYTKELKKYRKIHNIDDEHHQAALKQIGWTVPEFESGRKEHPESLEDHPVKRGWRWRLRDLYLRMFG